jgi:hypothetical protein
METVQDSIRSRVRLRGATPTKGTLDLDRPTIYALCEPETSQIRYVGMSINVLERYRQHCARRTNTHLGCWITSLRRRGLKPLLMILDQCEDLLDLRALEVFYIAWLDPDLNVDDGSMPVPSFAGRKHSPETREKMRLAQLGKRAPQKANRPWTEARRQAHTARLRRSERGTFVA